MLFELDMTSFNFCYSGEANPLLLCSRGYNFCHQGGNVFSSLFSGVFVTTLIKVLWLFLDWKSESSSVEAARP